MTDLTPEVIEKTPDWRHNWLYSVLPITNRFYTYSQPANEQDGLYLSGYCKTCQRAFTVRLPHDTKEEFVKVTQLDIPRWGCTDPNNL